MQAQRNSLGAGGEGGSRSRWLTAAAAFGFWTVIGLCFASQLYLTQSKIGNPVSWSFAAGRSLADWYVFAALSAPAIWLARRMPLEGRWRAWRGHLAAHAAGSVIFSFLWMASRAGIEWARGEMGGQPVGFEAAFRHALVATFFFNLLIYWVIVSVSHAFGFYRKLHERELLTKELQERLAEARLQALQMQLNPHFLFNTLHAISALMHRDVEMADRMIAKLSGLLRHTLESTDEQEVSLEQELCFLDGYLEIERTRFGDRLTIAKEIGPGTAGARVPNLILQPLVENAIQHGIEPHARPGKVSIASRVMGDSLELRVWDNGGGFAGAKVFEEGVGLTNTRVRLRHLYGDKQTFEMSEADGGGVLVRVMIPLRSAAGDGRFGAEEKEKTQESA